MAEKLDTDKKYTLHVRWNGNPTKEEKKKAMEEIQTSLDKLKGKTSKAPIVTNVTIVREN